MGSDYDKSEKYSNDLIWLDESINDEMNRILIDKLKIIFTNFKGCQSLNECFENFYQTNSTNYKIIIVIVSGKYFGRYVQKIRENINKIINIPYTFIFTSTYFKNILLNSFHDRNHELSYDTKVNINNGFYNPGGVYDNFENLLSEIKILCARIRRTFNNRFRIVDKLNYEGILTFEYVEKKEDLLAPLLYKDIITNEKITEEECKRFHNFLLSFNEPNLNRLIQNLNFFKYIPYEILSKFWARCYTMESNFYKILNNNLMKSQITPNYKTFIKMLYTGVEINSLNSFHGMYLYRGASITKREIKKIFAYIKMKKLSHIIVFSKAFLSFSENKIKAMNFCGSSDNTKYGCLYILENYYINLHESNADIQNISVFPDEKEILFFPGSSFRIKSIKKMNDNKLEITLNYIGKFREKYFLYDNQKINNLIENNYLTKNIAGKKLEFLKGGKYLKGEKIDATTFKGKNLETDENVCIKQIDKKYISRNEFISNYISTLNFIKQNIQNCVSLKEFFESNNHYYIVQNIYDDNLENFMRINKRLTPNLVNKIFKQINKTIYNLVNFFYFIIVRPSNILIKYCNQEKTNFDSFLSDYSVSAQIFEKNKNNYCNLMACNMMIPGNFEIQYPNYLYSIGLTIYYLYFGKLPFSNIESYSNEQFNTLLNQQRDINVIIKEDSYLEDLVDKLLKPINKRLNFVQYFNHPFFEQYKY